MNNTSYASAPGKGVKNPNRTKNIVIACVVIVLAAILIGSSIVIVPAGSTGVVVTLGKVSDHVLQEGFHLKAPFITRVEVITNKIQVYESDAAAVSKDLQTVSSSIAVNYRVGLDQSAYIYKNIGRNYQDVVLRPAVQESVKSVTSAYTAEELITKRAQVGDEIKAALEDKVSGYGIIIEKFNIVNFDFSVEFNNAIEAKQVAEQNLIKTKTEQEQAIVIAEAEAKKKVIEATAEAEALLTRAQAQAEANERITGSLSSMLIDYQRIEKWNGALPYAVGDSAMILDLP